MEGAAAEEGNAAVTTPPAAAPTCPVCMEPWTCNGDHRICCIPCGHAYGRSCLERWLHRSAHDTAKCPQCGEQFEGKVIINLYALGNLWDGCCRLQELKAHYESNMKEMKEDVISVVTEHTSKLESELDRLGAKVKELIAEMHAEFMEHAAKMHAKLKKQNAEAMTEQEPFCADEEQTLDRIKRSWNQKKARADADMTLMKEQMKKMAEEENATATDLIEFMERNFSQLSAQCTLA